MIEIVTTSNTIIIHKDIERDIRIVTHGIKD